MNDRLTASMIVFLLAVLFRGGVGGVFRERLGDDPDAYQSIAVTLAQSGTFGTTGDDGTVSPTAFRPPAYPWMLSFLVDRSGRPNKAAVVWLHAVLGGITVALTFDMAMVVLGRRSLASLASTLVAIDPLLVWQSTVVMTETLATCLTTIVAWWWVTFLVGPKSRNRRFAVVGLAVWMALAYLCRPTFIVWAVLVFPLLAWVGPVCRVRRTVGMMMYAVVLLSVVGAWTLRNVSAVGHPVWATSHGGYTLLLANNESFYEHVRDGWFPFFRRPWDPGLFFEQHRRRFVGDVESAEFWTRKDFSESVPSPTRSWGEIQDDRLTQRAALATIRRDIPTFMASCVYRVTSLWNPIPHATADRPFWQIAVATTFALTLFAGSIATLIRHRRWCFQRAFWPMWTLAVALSVVHAVYFSNPRMRAPSEPLIAIFAVASLTGRVPTLTERCDVASS